MAKKKSKKAKPRKVVAKKTSSFKKASPKRTAKKKSSPKKKMSAKKPFPKTRTKKQPTPKAAKSPATRRSFPEKPYRSQESITDSAGQSGDLQGLSDVEAADSESVDELVEEGNAFEADVVSGVERAGNEEGREVHTHEVPEDDVPEEYLDEQ
jgi:hypothetical protein